MLKKRQVLTMVSIAIAIVVMVSFSTVASGNQPSCLAYDGGVVEKAPCEAFTVKVTFQNTGKTEGTWSVNIAFEGESWTWNGTPQDLTLEPCHKKTLTWNGSIPEEAPIGSVARLIVYYNDSYIPLNWWIHVVSDAELAITSSTVK